MPSKAKKKNRPAKTKKKSIKPGEFLGEISFAQEYRTFKRNRKLNFRPGVNLLVGEQGSGKSSLIDILIKYCSKSELENEKARKTIKILINGEAPILNFDFEKDNVRTQSHLSASGAGIAFQMNSHFSSHGEVSMAILKGLEAEASKPTLILLDEPDMALSPKNAILLGRQFSRLAVQGHQILAAVHNPLVIASQLEVLSLEHKKWLKSDKFLAAQAEAAT